MTDNPAFTILVTGDRHWSNVDVIRAALKEATKSLDPKVRVIVLNGGAHGADSCAMAVGNSLEWCVVTMNARWGLYGNGAGPRRNSEMLALEPDIVLAFHNDLSQSRGTRDMIQKAQASGKQVILYNSKGEKSVV